MRITLGGPDGVGTAVGVADGAGVAVACNTAVLGAVAGAGVGTVVDVWRVTAVGVYGPRIDGVTVGAGVGVAAGSMQLTASTASRTHGIKRLNMRVPPGAISSMRRIIVQR
jgi:hypothetical protein